MKTNKNVIRRNVAGDDILIPVHDSAKEHNGLFVLTPTGAEIWDMLVEEKSPEEIVEIISREYEVDAEMVRADVDALIKKLKDMGLLED
jgi:DNA-binding CsgD family transcriptional regulator